MSGQIGRSGNQHENIAPNMGEKTNKETTLEFNKKNIEECMEQNSFIKSPYSIRRLIDNMPYRMILSYILFLK